MRCIEDICVFYKKMPKYNPQGLKKLDKPIKRNEKRQGDTLWRVIAGVREQKYTNYPKHLLEYSKDKNNIHPTQKPVDLLEYLIKTYTNPGETVLDNCMGSGSTGVACMNTGRKFIGIEKEIKYFEISKQRISGVAFSVDG